MSKDVLETLLILDFKARGRGRRFQYATYGPPAPEGGRTIKEYAVRLAPATQAAAGPEGSAPPATLVPPQYTFVRVVCSSLSNATALTPKPAAVTASRLNSTP